MHIAWDAQEILRDIAEVQYEYQHSAHEYLEFMKRHRATYSPLTDAEANDFIRAQVGKG